MIMIYMKNIKNLSLFNLQKEIIWYHNNAYSLSSIWKIEKTADRKYA